MENTRKTSRDSGAYIGAAVLIVVGLAALVANLGGGAYVYESIPLALGVGFLTAYALTRQYGFLVPGGILAGVGAGLVAGSLLNVSDNGPYAAIGGGLGFLLIFAVDAVVSRQTARWWPVIPGGLMVVAGGQALSTDQELLRQLAPWSPALLIVLGIVILIARAGRRAA